MGYGLVESLRYTSTMIARASFLNCIVTALGLFVVSVPAASAQTPALDYLFTQLSEPENPRWKRIEQDIWREWSKSGSAAMDLLLQRGRDAMDAGDLDAAIAHLTALTDHAPDFAEGWNARATAYFQAGLYGPAIDDIAHVLKLNPRHFGALSGLGLILEQLGMDDRAMEVYETALAIHPHLEAVRDAVQRLTTEAEGQEL